MTGDGTQPEKDKADESDLPCPVEAPDDRDDSLEPVAVSNGARDADDTDAIEIPEHLPILPARDTCAFPGTVVPLQISREKSKRVLDMALAGSRLIAVVAQRSAETEDPHLDDLYRVGTACVILKMLKMADGSETIIIHGVRRVGVEAITEEDDYLEATVHAHIDPKEVSTEQRALAHSIRTAAERIIELSPNIPDEARQVLDGIEHPGGLADFLAANLSLSLVHKQELLETLDVTERLRKVNVAVAAQLEVAELSNKIQQQVRGQVDKSQREYYLREQLKAIRQELGEGDTRSATLDRLQERIKAAQMPEAVEAEAKREVERLEHIPQASPEYSMTLDYVEWLVEMPWAVSTEDSLDIHRAEGILDEDHFGLEKVKKRILEFLAVRTLKSETRGPILCFAGPPGVGKTSLGRSIARAMGRNFIRISLGGIRDEATIRGHRRTYVGSMPGQIIREIRRAGSNNPLFMLDEVDKIGQDFRGDPMSAMLEVLDPAQNASFTDHYLGLPFDLSKVFFITTANYMSAIEPALRDRMEVIEISGYTQHEKLMIAKRHLLPRQLDENGLTADQLHLGDDVLSVIVSEYTREAGVRGLERNIGSVCRARAAAVVRGESPDPAITVEDLRNILGPRKFEPEVAATLPVPGVVTGLAFTPTGGEILFVEAAAMPGTGQLKLTGQLGDVMRESAVAASSIVRSRSGKWNVKARDFGRLDIHIHVPAGATPKDGPSAGLAILTAVTSVLTGRGVDPAVGMTGEITLSGRVLPVGGIREKVLAAYRAGLKSVILPARNQQDLEEVPDDVRGQIKFLPVRTIDQLFGLVFDGKSKRSGTARRIKKEHTKTAKKSANVSRRGAARSSKSAKRGARAAKRGSLQAKSPTAWNREL